MMIYLQLQKWFNQLEGTLDRKTWRLVLLGAAAGTALFFSILSVRPEPFEWKDAYRPAALLLATGQSPFSVAQFYNAPWVLIPLIPFALLPENVGGALVFILALAAFGYIAYRLKAKPWSTIAFLLSYPVGLCLYTGQIDWLIVLGFVLPAPVGLFLVLAKPQIGFAVAIFWAIEAWQKGSWRRVLAVFAPVTIAFGLSFLLYGFWPLKSQAAMTNIWNYSFWPLSIGFGMILVASGIRQKKIEYFIAASPFFAPFVSAQSWLVVLVALLPYPVELLAGAAGFWLWYIIRIVGAGGK
jgi:hypothetical protein